MDLVHRLLSLPAAARPILHDLLGQLAEAFDATGAGLAPLPDAAPAVRVGRPPTAVPLPWEADPTLLARLREPGSAHTFACRPQGSLAAVVAGGADGPDCLLWVEDERRDAWTPGETAALALFGHAFILPTAPRDHPQPAEWGERRQRQRRLEHSAGLMHKLAHDFGNVLTGILGFTELSLGQRVAPGSALHNYLGEIHRGAKGAAAWTRLLQLCALGDPAGPRYGKVADAARAAADGLLPAWDAGTDLVFDLPPELPTTAAHEDHLRQAVHNLLENAYDALPGGKGVVTLAARSIDLTAAECLAYYGRLRPGPHVLVRVDDTGSGLSAAVQQRLFAEPFFSTKPRRRGLGLAVVYGIVAAYRGGLRLENGPVGGAVAEIVLPALPAGPPPVVVARAAIEKKLVSGVGRDRGSGVGRRASELADS